MSIFNYPNTVLDPALIMRQVDAAFTDLQAQIDAGGGGGGTGPAGPMGPAGPQGPAGEVPEAPTDGSQFIRCDGAWENLEVSADANNLAMLGTDKSIYVPDAPQDGSLYGRQSGAWAAVSGGGTQGPPGPAGPPGPQGSPGPAGAQGDPGPAGPQGDVGPPGSAGDIGPAGPAGPAGAVGATGDPGPAGPAGADGVQGPIGVQGVAGDPGPQGTQGPQGPAGADGPQGAAGADGVQGPVGAQGPVGPVGLQGPAGNDGQQGPAGPQGIQGPQGLQGDVGPQGPAGADGAPGPQGNIGPQGQQGPQGNTSSIFNYAFSTSTVAPPVTNGTVEIDVATPANATNLYISNLTTPGNDISVILGLIQTGNEILLQNADDATQYYSYTVTAGAFTTQPGYQQIPVAWKAGAGTLTNNMNILLGIISQGQQGPAGPVGSAGPQGVPGPTGAPGNTGPAGPVGPQGPQGDAGPQGLQGPPGTAGIQGPAGSAGAIGVTGSQGPQGPQGLQGPQGIPGPTAVSANVGNQATLGSDNLIFVPLTPAASNATPTMDGAGAAGTATTWARGDHTHPTDTSRYAANNPAGYVNAAGAASAAPVQSVAGRNGAVTLTHNDITDWAGNVPAASSATPAMDGTAAAGAATVWARGDHVHPTDSSRQAIKGTVAADNAAAGNIGEQIAVSQATGVTLTTGVGANVATLTLTPGDWAVSGVIVFAEAANTVPTMLAAAIALASATLPTAAQIVSGTGNMTQYNMAFTKGVVSQTMQTGICRVNVAANTSVYLVAQSIFTTAGLSATGYISARRVR